MSIKHEQGSYSWMDGQSSSLSIRTKKSHSKLPRVRPCCKCGHEKTIVAHGLCDACRKREERQSLNHPGFGQREQKETGIQLLANVVKILNKARVPHENRRIILQNLVPSLGFMPRTEAGLIEDLVGPGINFDSSLPGRKKAGKFR